MAYHLRDQEPETFRDAFRSAVNIKNNRKASSNLGRRDDPKLFNLKNNKKKNDKALVGKKLEEPTIGQVLDLLKKLNPTVFNSHKPNVGEKDSANSNHFNRLRYSGIHKHTWSRSLLNNRHYDLLN